MEQIVFNPIGIIHSPFRTISNMPIQPMGAKGINGSIEVYNEFVNGLKDIEGFSHLILLYHLHKITHWEHEVLPFMDTEKHGIFATRAPARPNAIGISIVKLLKRTKNLLDIEEVDILDGTPLIDIKPFYGLYDNRREYTSGWIDNLKNKTTAANMKSDDRFK